MRKMSEKEGLALRVIDLAKAQALADNHFLAAAVGRLRPAAASLALPFATDGRHLAFDVERVLSLYVSQKEAPKHDLMHTVLHCVFVHPYVGPSIDAVLWDLACDMVVERNVAEVCGPRSGNRGTRISRALSVVESELGKRPGAEKLYKAFKGGMWADKAREWRGLFQSDDHVFWYLFDASFEGGLTAAPDAQSRGQGGDFASMTIDAGQEASSAGGAESSGDDRRASNESGDRQQASSRGETGCPRESEDVDREQGRGLGLASKTHASLLSGVGLHEAKRADRSAEQEEWRRVARALAVNLQTYSRSRGKALDGMVADMEDAARIRVDYSDFLRQFAISGEVLKVSDDEFDYVFYTYGLSLYGNLPLIEPLEYREEKRIREFVIIVDTSGSVWGSIVKRFIDTTFDILKSTEAFFERVHVRIIQCDAAVQSDDVITSLAELKEWGRTMRLHGGGGTDFRPAFAYVDKLIEDGKFENLGGLIYFTDGYGEYPEWMPDYKTAFVFYDEDYRPECVPPWAAQIVLDNAAIDGNSGIR